MSSRPEKTVAAEADDDFVLERATQSGRLVYTNDDDFSAIAKRWLGMGRDFAGLAYAHPLRITGAPGDRMPGDHCQGFGSLRLAQCDLNYLP